MDPVGSLVEEDLKRLILRLRLEGHAGALRDMGAVSFETVLMHKKGPAGVAEALGLQGEERAGWLEAFGEE